MQGAGQVAFNQDTLQEISDSIQPGVWTKASKGQMSWDNPTIVKALTIWKEMFTDGIMEPGALGVQQYPDANNDFMSGKFAMVMMGTWYMQYATQAGMPPRSPRPGSATPSRSRWPPFPSQRRRSGKPRHHVRRRRLRHRGEQQVSHQAAGTTFATWLTT